MAFPALAKQPDARPHPGARDYDAAYAPFTWDAARAPLDGLPDGGLNIAHEAVDRHARGARARPRRPALPRLRSRGGTGGRRRAHLRASSPTCTGAVRRRPGIALGVEAGERVFSLMGRRPELYVAILGSFKHRAVFCPLFSAFGPEPVRAAAAAR